MKEQIITPIADVEKLLLACWEAGEYPNLIGPPGIGKTDVVGDAAAAYAALKGYGPQSPKGLMPFLARSCATMTGEDIVVPDRDEHSGQVIHKPVGAFRVLAGQPAILLADEINRTGHGTQNAFLMLWQNGIVGDFKLHPESRLVSAMNDADEEGGDGAHDRLTALADRQVDIRVEATFAGWFDYATKRIGAPGSSLKALATDYAYCADRSRGLLSLYPTPGVDKRPSPRAVKKGLAVFDAALNTGLTLEHARVLLAGCVGGECADAFLAIRKIRQHLPTDQQIETDPLNALLPHSVDVAWAVTGLLGVVASRKPDPAWLYIGRMGSMQEVQLAAARMLTRGAKPPLLPDAVKIRDRMMGMEGLARLGQTAGLSW